MSASPAPWLARRIEHNLALHKASYEGNIEECKRLLAPAISEGEWDGSADAWYADEDMLRWDALHYAADGGHAEVVRLLLQSGAPWNAVDALGYTAADIAWSRNHTACYGLLFEEGVRQSFLVQKLAQHADIDAAYDKPADSASGEEADVTQDHALRSDTDDAAHLTLVSGSQNEVTHSNTDFLHSRLTFTQDARGQWRCLDQDNNMVMAEWENEIMLASAKALCEGQKEGFSVLNVGFGLGIVDEAMQTYRPGRHVIIEPHPDVLAFMRQRGWDQRPGVEIFEGTWEQFLMPEDDKDGEIAMKLGDFDAIYFDTYSQDYAGTYAHSHQTCALSSSAYPTCSQALMLAFLSSTVWPLPISFSIKYIRAWLSWICAISASQRPGPHCPCTWTTSHGMASSASIGHSTNTFCPSRVCSWCSRPTQSWHVPAARARRSPALRLDQGCVPLHGPYVLGLATLVACGSPRMAHHYGVRLSSSHIANSGAHS